MTPQRSLNPLAEPSPTPSPSSTAPALVLSNSGKRIDQAGKKKYVKQVTGRHNDTELHLAAQRGDLAAVKQVLDDIDSQMVGTLSGADFDTEVAEVQAAVVNEVNELGETALYTGAEKGYLDIVKELLKYSSKETLTKKNQSGFDPLHIAASQGHNGNGSICFSCFDCGLYKFEYGCFSLNHGKDCKKMKIDFIWINCTKGFYKVLILFIAIKRFSLQLDGLRGSLQEEEGVFAVILL